MWLVMTKTPSFKPRTSVLPCWASTEMWYVPGGKAFALTMKLNGTVTSTSEARADDPASAIDAVSTIAPAGTLMNDMTTSLPPIGGASCLAAFNGWDEFAAVSVVIGG